MTETEYQSATQMRAQAAPWHSAIELMISTFDLVSKRRAIGRVIFEEVEPGQMVDSTLRLNYDAAQMLMDDLWQCGLRPTEGTGSAGALKATEKHLEDMRKIAILFLEKLERESIPGRMAGNG